MPLHVLGSRDVSKILHSFTKDDIFELQETLADALHWYSTSTDELDCCSDYQPERTALKRKDGSTTMFMPASGMVGQGIKVLNFSPEDKDGLPSLAESTSDGDSRSSLSSDRAASFSTTARTKSEQSNTSLVTKITDQAGNLSLSSPADSGQHGVSAVKGSLTLFDNSGNTVGLINAEDLTAFRTALASTMLLKKRQSVHDVTIFGAGKQAYWHARLALLLRGDEIHHLNIITRNFDSARNCILRLYNPQPDNPNFVNPLGDSYDRKTKMTILTPAHTEYGRLLKEYVRSSNVIFMCTPSEQPLFPGTYLTNPEGRKKGRYVACVGSHTPHMIELHPDVLRYAVAPHHEHKHIHKRQKEGGAVLVDTVSGCLKDSGEVVQAKLLPDQVVELGELLMLKRDAEQKARENGDKIDVGAEGCHLQDDSGLREWLSKGNVIYKSVGLGLMDVVVGGEFLRIGEERGIGTRVEHF